MKHCGFTMIDTQFVILLRNPTNSIYCWAGAHKPDGASVLDREENSNLSQLLKFMAAKDAEFGKWLKKKNTYTSPDNQNELLDIMGRIVSRSLSKRIKSAKHFTIMVDETPDCSNKEQAVFCLRYALCLHEENDYSVN